jgi:P4 family phage/plasmid primase-like protien
MTNLILTDLKHEIQPHCNLDDLYHHMSINGIDCDQPIHFDGRIHRFSRDNKRNQRDEWYIAYQGISAKGNHYFVVTYGSWSDGSKFTYTSWNNKDYDEKEREELHLAFQKRQEEAHLAIVEAQNQSAESALQIWEGSSLEAESESYLQYATLKKITPYCARFGKNPHGLPSIILPLVNFEGIIRSLQFISVGEDGTVYKTFLEGGEKKGNYMLLGNIQDGKTIQVAEGYATACDCYKATGSATVVAFDCGNLTEVVPKLRQRYSRSEIIICADDDAHRPNNPGRTAALEVASQYGCKVALPKFPDSHKESNLTDFNDLAQIVDIQEAKKQIESAQTPLKIWLEEIERAPLEAKLRHPIYQLAHQSVIKGNLPEKDFIINELCKLLKLKGITKTSITKEFKEYIKEKIIVGVNPAKNTLSDDEAKIVETLTEQFGPPIALSPFGEAAGINQLFFANKYARETLILYEPFERGFYEYQVETGLWVLKSDDTVKVDLGHSFMRLINLLGFKELLTQRTENLLRQLLNLLKGSIEQADAFHSKRGIIHIGNGVIHLKDDPDHLRQFSPDYYSRNRSEILMKQEAECPRFFNALLQPAMPTEDIELLQKYCGQCLLGYNPSQTILLISGTPGGGKSTLVSIIEKIIGLHNVAQLKMGLLCERFENASFVGKTLLTGKDVPGNFLNNPGGASVLKALVGADRLSVEQKNLKRRIEIRGEFNIIITSNARLHVRLDSDIGAWKRRLLIIEFEQAAPNKPIAHLDDILITEEGAGILNWMIEGAVKLFHDLDQYGRIQLSKEQSQRVEGLLAESDSIRSFVLNCVEVRHGSDVTTAELIEAYTAYCEGRGWRAETVSSFENQIRNIMLETHRLSRRNDIKRNGKSQRGYMHVALRIDQRE